MQQNQRRHAITPSRKPVADSAPSPRSVAGAALSYLNDMPSSPTPLPLPATAYGEGLDDADGGGWTAAQTLVDTPPATSSDDACSAINIQSCPISVDDIDPSLTWHAPPAVPGPLPSLLRYVDNDLLREKELHDNPPEQHARCAICGYMHNKAPVPSTFLPLSPCGCWIHYRCFVWHATRDEPNHDRCPLCNITLFEWEGITAITVATRTGFGMQDKQYPESYRYIDGHTGQLVHSDLSEYFAECTYIETVIHRRFFEALSHHSTLPDKSPDLIKYYYEVLKDLDDYRKVKSKWLSWSTPLGYLLYGMLIAEKMRRYLVEKQTYIQRTEAWKQFERGRQVLQGKILDQVGDTVADVSSEEANSTNLGSQTTKNRV